MAINKIIVDGVTKIDLSQDTVTADKVIEGLTFHDATGSLCTGTLTENTGSADVGDITFYTKLAYTYEDYVTNSSTAGQITAYLEDGSPCTTDDMFYVVITSAGNIGSISGGSNPQFAVPSSGGKVYVASTKKITSVDVNFSGGCGS